MPSAWRTNSVRNHIQNVRISVGRGESEQAARAAVLVRLQQQRREIHRVALDARRHHQLEVDELGATGLSRVQDVVGFGIEAGVTLVEDRRDLNEALRNVGLLAAAEGDDRELAQQLGAVLVGPARDPQRKVDKNDPACFVRAR